MKYRAEIDGLRALAVIPVIFFHAGFQVFSGGFVGVDVFFVISGYLITTIIISDIENKSFSLANFWARRARRILPALFFVMLACIPFAFMWMLPVEMKSFSSSLIAVSLFLSNILFWQESGYFAATADEKPLLHTWSLAIEEQYYVLFPIFLLFAWRLGKNKVFIMIVILATISFLLSEWGWRNKPNANFYFAPTRAWELFAGSVAAFITQNESAQKNNALSLLGASAIIFSIFYYDGTMPYPSYYTLVPVIGSVLVLLYARQGTFVARFLSTKLFVGVGLISYSAYLWHQPLFAFARIKILESPSPILMAILSLCSLILAFISWRYIECPIRKASYVSNKTVYFISFIGILGFVSMGYVGYVNNGFDGRLTADQKEILKWEANPTQVVSEVGCFLNPEQDYSKFSEKCNDFVSNTVIWGDSHAASLAVGWKHLSQIHQFTASACPPILGVYFVRRPHCQNINEKVAEIISKGHYSRVILHANWFANNPMKLQKLENTLEFLQTLDISEILLIGGVPQYSPSLPQKIM